MHKIFFLSGLLLVATSCCTTRLQQESSHELNATASSQSASENSVHSEATTDTGSHLFSGINFNAESNIEIEGSVTTTTTEYDPDKPADPTTGLPPVKSQTTTTTNFRIKEGKKATADFSYEWADTSHQHILLDSLGQSNSSTDIALTERQQTKVKRTTKSWGLQTYCTIAAIIVVVGFIARRGKWLQKLTAIFKNR